MEIARVLEEKDEEKEDWMELGTVEEMVSK